MLKLINNALKISFKVDYQIQSFIDNYFDYFEHKGY